MKRSTMVLYASYRPLMRLYSHTRRLPPLRWTIEAFIGGWARRLARQQHLRFPQRTTGGWWWKERYRFEFLMGWLELESVRQVQAFVTADMVVVDIGAHIGYYTLLLARLVGAQGRVYALEANRDNYDLLVANVAAAGLTNVVSVHTALWDKEEDVELFLTAGHSTHSLHSSEETVEHCRVPGTTLDAYLRSQGNPNVRFIKIDIEGAEPLAFKGMTETVARAADLVLLTELNPPALRLGGVTPAQFVQQLHDMAFSVQTLAEDRIPALALTLESPVLQQNTLINLFCRKLPDSIAPTIAGVKQTDEPR